MIDDVGPGTGPLTSGQTTNDNQPTLTGTGAVGDTISIYNNGVLLDSVVIGNTGTELHHACPGRGQSRPDHPRDRSGGEPERSFDGLHRRGGFRFRHAGHHQRHG